MMEGPGINKVILLGNIVTAVQSNINGGMKKEYAFSLVTSEMINKKNGSQELLEYHHIRLSDHVSHLYATLKKGDLIYLEGRVQTSNRQDEQGIKRFKTEVVATKICLMNNNGRLIDAGDEVKGRALVNR